MRMPLHSQNKCIGRVNRTSTVPAKAMVQACTDTLALSARLPTAWSCEGLHQRTRRKSAGKPELPHEGTLLRNTPHCRCPAMQFLVALKSPAAGSLNSAARSRHSPVGSTANQPHPAGVSAQLRSPPTSPQWSAAERVTNSPRHAAGLHQAPGSDCAVMSSTPAPQAELGIRCPGQAQQRHIEQHAQRRRLGSGARVALPPPLAGARIGRPRQAGLRRSDRPPPAGATAPQ